MVSDSRFLLAFALALALARCGGNASPTPLDSGTPPVDSGTPTADSGTPLPDAGCTPQTDGELCAALGAECGGLSANDNCGAARTIDCGSCTGPETCGGGGTANVCGCAPESDADFCAALGASCGSVSGADNCGAARTIDCGGCTGPETCGGAGTANVCGCTPESDADFCAALGDDCGSVSGNDNCGLARTADCGSCSGAQTCGGGGTPNVCGCTPEDDAAFCSRLGKDCGAVTEADNCGTPRTASCGTCTAPATCGRGGVPNVCGCETDQEFCARVGTQCANVAGTDSCGQPKSVAWCGGAWVQEASLPVGGPGASAAWVDFDGGTIVWTQNTSLLEYDATGAGWIQQPDSPYQSFYGVGAAIGDTFYVAGGYDSTAMNPSLWSYVPATAAWTQLASMPAGPRMQAGGAILDGSFYVAGGESDRASTDCDYWFGICSRLEAYTPGVGWSELPPMAQKRDGPAVAALGSRLYVAGGAQLPGDNCCTTVKLSSVEAYSPADNAWSSIAPMSKARLGASAVAADGRMYVIGGGDDSMEIYDEDAGTWSPGPSMHAARSWGTAVMADQVVHAIGGTADGIAVEGYCVPLCDGGACPLPSCTDGTQDGLESDVDCGGSACGGCAQGKHCRTSGDCLYAYCGPQTGTCDDSCSDGAKDGVETDLDCGGPICDACGVGQACSVPSDCSTGFCTSGTCSSDAQSCKAILASAPGSPSGTYTIDPDGVGAGAPVQVYCDMTTAGGGWTFLGHTLGTDNGTPVFEVDVGAYDATRSNWAATYSLGQTVNQKVGATEMMVTLDSADPATAGAASKLVFYSFASGAAGFASGPVPCSAASFDYKLTAAGSYAAGSFPICNGTYWGSAVGGSNAPLLQLENSAAAGVMWGQGLGGDGSWNHDAWWFVR